MELPEKSVDDLKTEAEVREHLREIVEAHGGPAAFSRSSGIPLSSLNNYLGKTALKAGVLWRIADTAGITLDQLFRRNLAVVNVSSGTADDYVPVPILDVRASAGRGRASLPAETVADQHMLFQRSWLRSLGVTPENAELLTAQGDSMYPTIQDGDLMLNDRGYGDVVHGKIYTLVVNDLVVVKRINMLAVGGMMLISDNDRYPTETVMRDEVNALNFQGRVAWFGRPI